MIGTLTIEDECIYHLETLMEEADFRKEGKEANRFIPGEVIKAATANFGHNGHGGGMLEGKRRTSSVEELRF